MLTGIKTGVKQLKKTKTSPSSVKRSTEVNITKLTPAEKQQPNLSLSSLPADVLWGSFVTHSFLPHGRLLNRADICVHQSQAVYVFL